MSSIYATHLALLRAIGRVLNPRHVLEFGAGYFSTGVFLDRDCYPVLITLDSIEQQETWRETIRGMFKDKRLFLSPRRPDTPLDNYDLIFIDDGQSAIERVETIKQVVQARPPCPVIIHDFENPVYRHAADFDWVLEYDRETPHTALLWNGDAVSEEQKEAIRDYL